MPAAKRTVVAVERLPDMRYCPDCCRVTEAVVVDSFHLDVMCTECKRFLANPFLAIELARAANADPAPRKKQRKARSDADEGAAASAPRVRVDVGVGPTTDRARVEGFDAISDMADRLGIAATVRDRAKEVFKKAEEAKAWPRCGRKDRNRDVLYAACLFVACRSEGTPLTFKELASVTADGAAAKKDIGKLAALIKKNIGEEAGQAAGIGVVRAANYMSRFGPLLGMGNQEVAAAQEAARRLEDGLDIRRNPQSIAAAIIYMATERAGAKKSVPDVAMATGVCESTITAVYRDLCPHAGLLFG